MTETIQRHFPNEVHQQPDAIRRTAEATIALLETAEFRQLLDGVQRVVWTGSGDCYFIGSAIASFFEEFAGLPASWIEAYDFVQNTPAIDERSLVIGFSSSGKSVYTVEAITKARRIGARTLAVANKADSRLQEAASASILTHAGDSFTFPTKTSTSALLVGLMLAQHMRTPGGLEAPIMVDAESIARAMADALGRGDEIAAAYAPGIAAARRTLVVGSGLGRTAAMLGAAKLVETSHVATTACNCEEFLHLQGFGTTAEDAVVVVHDGNRRSELAIEYAVSQGCHTVVVDHGEANLPEATHVFKLPGSGSDIVDMFASIAALHVLALAVSQEKGTNPDIPAGVDLGYVIGLLYTDPVDGWNDSAAQGLRSEG